MVAVARREVTVRAPRRATERRAVDVRVRVAGERRADGHLWVARGGVVGGADRAGSRDSRLTCLSGAPAWTKCPATTVRLHSRVRSRSDRAFLRPPLLHPPQSPGARSMATLVRAWRVVTRSRGRPFAAGLPKPPPTRAPGRRPRPRASGAPAPRKRDAPKSKLALPARAPRPRPHRGEPTMAYLVELHVTPDILARPPAAGARRSSTPRTRRCRARDSTRRRRTPRSPTRAWSTPSKPSTARSPRRAAPSSGAARRRPGGGAGRALPRRRRRRDRGRGRRRERGVRRGDTRRPAQLRRRQTSTDGTPTSCARTRARWTSRGV